MSEGPAIAERPVNLRLAGRLRVLEALNCERSVSRSDLAERTGLARATVASIVADLAAEGIVVDIGPVTGGIGGPGATQGRPPRLVRLTPESGYAVGLDIARDHLRVMVCDLTGTPRSDSGPVPFAVDSDPAGALHCAAQLLTDVTGSIEHDRILGLGVGIASPVDRRSGTLLSEAVLPMWLGIPVAEELARATGLKVEVVNDANAGLLAERRFGAARDVDDAIYIRLSAGIGAGLICDGRMILGAAGIAGELGHVTVDRNGSICRCGNRGCLETVASPAALGHLLSPGLGHPVGAAEVLELVAAGHGGAVRAVADAGSAAGQALAHAVMIVNPSLIVVGGELAEAGDVLFEPMRRAIERNTMHVHSAKLRIVPGVLGDAAGVRGAAALVLSDAPRRLAART